MALIRIYYDATATPGTGDGTIGNPYANYPELEAAEAYDLVTAGDDVEVRRLDNSTDNVPFETISGWVTGPNNVLYIISNDGNRKLVHNNVEGARMIRVTSPDNAYVRFKGFDLYMDQSVTERDCVHIFSVDLDSDIRFDNVRLWGTTGGEHGFQLQGGVITITNSAVFNCSGRGISLEMSAATGLLYLRYVTVTGGSNRGIHCASGAGGNFKNCYSGGNSQQDYYQAPDLEACGSSDATGTAGLTNIAYTESPTLGSSFLNLTAGSEDFGLDPVNSSLEDSGVDVSADSDRPVSVDAAGNTRSLVNPDISMYETQAGGASYERIPDAEIEFIDQSTTTIDIRIDPDAPVTFVDQSITTVDIQIVPDLDVVFADVSTTTVDISVIPDSEILFLDQSAITVDIQKLPDAEIDFNDQSSTSEATGDIQITPDLEVLYADISVTSVDIRIIPDAEIEFNDQSDTTSGFKIVPDLNVQFDDQSVLGYNITRIPDAEIEFNDQSITSVDISIVPDLEVVFIDVSDTQSGFKIVPDLNVQFTDVSQRTFSLWRYPDLEVEFADQSQLGGAIERIPDLEIAFFDQSITFEDSLSNIIVKTEVDLANIVINHLVLNWDVEGENLPLIFENEDYSQTAQYAKVFILRAQTTDAYLGGNTLVDRRTGILQMNVYTAVGDGAYYGLDYAERLGALFQHRVKNGVTFQQLTIRSFPDLQNDRSVHVVEIPYYWDETVELAA